MLGTEVRQTLDQLTSQLRDGFGEDLLAVVLHGSAARGDHMAGGSDLNVVAVVKDLSLDELARGGEAMRRWEQQGNRPVLFLSPEWIERSCDVFPLEFLDILESHVVVFGTDPFAGLTVSHANLRLQCESELKTKLLHLRTGYVEFHQDADQLCRLVAASYASIAAVGRGVLRLGGLPVPDSSQEVLREVARLCGLETAPFDQAAALKRRGPSALSMKASDLFKAYYGQVERLARAVDAGLTHTGGSTR
jgi:hypothetical protein